MQTLVLAATLAVLHPDPVAKTTWGAPVRIGAGTARTYAVTTGGRTVELGVLLSEAVMRGLPGAHDPGMVHGADGHTMTEHVLALPTGHGTGYRHLVVNWNPGGHEPPGIYDRPHFDFHFYVVSDATRRAIDPADPHYQAKAARTPAPAGVPAGYVLPAATPFPRMGVHWVDPTSPELGAGDPFTRTFIFGSWDGALIFAEPMITKAYLETKPDVVIPVPQAADRSGFPDAPTAYRIRWDPAAKGYRVALILGS